MIATTREWVSRHGWTIRPRCLKCGRGKFANIDNSKQEEKVMAYLRCKHDGCDKGGAIQGYCNNHFAEKYGITASQYKAEKRGRSEDPLEVARRVLKKASEKRKLEAEQDAPGLIKKAPDPTAEKAAEEIKPTLRFYSEGPFLLVTLPPEVKEALGAKAKAEYRSPEQQAAYLIEKGLEVKA